MGKNRGRSSGISTGWMVFIAALIVVGTVFGVKTIIQPASVAPSGIPTIDQTSTDLAASDFCAQNPTPDLKLETVDVLPTSAAGIATPILVEILDASGNPTGEITSYTVGTSVTTISNALTCGRGARIYAMTNQTNVTGFVKPDQAKQGMARVETSQFADYIEITAAKTLQNPVSFIGKNALYVVAYDGAIGLEAKTYDNDIASFLIGGEGENVGTTTAGTPTYESLPATFNSTTNGTVAKAIANGESIDYELRVKVNTSDNQCGMGTIFLLDYKDSTDTEDWVESSMEVSVDGVAVTDGLNSAVSANDRSAVSSTYELGYIAKPIADSEVKFRVRADTNSDSTVTIDRDINGRIVCLGNYESAASKGSILKKVGFRDDGSTRTEVVQSTAQTFVWRFS